jgi:D-alanine-D-alanine ligase
MNLDALKSKRIAVLLGGRSPEREVSLMSGTTVREALTELGAVCCAIDTADANWWLQLENIDLAFIALHGPGGEDGVIQGALETLGVAYTGSGVLASALAMDKLRSKRLWRGIGLATADFVELEKDSDWEAVLAQLGPVFVKPATGGSSIATCAARTPQELAAAWKEAAPHGGRVIAEQLIEGGEYTVSVLGDRVLPAISMETDNEFYDYEAKYLSDDTQYKCPCGLEPEVEQMLGNMALEAFQSLGCEVWGRVDFMRDAQGRFYTLEVNTVPGMTSHSLVPMAARAAGIELPELVGRIAIHSLERET